MAESVEMRAAVRDTYGPADLSSVPVFAGGFINFGYWGAVDLAEPISVEDRVRSQEDLYRQVLDAVGPHADMRLLEVGCGLGVGCALALREGRPAHITGMDIHPQQLDRARLANAALLEATPSRLRFVRGAAEEMPFDDGEFDRVLSVEAAQHFDDMIAFAHETARVLKPGGRVAVASFFTPDDDPDHSARLAALLESYADGLDIARPVTLITKALTWAGLTDARAVSIGPEVWEGWDRWLSDQWKPGTWPRNFLKAYQEGDLDYYVITATRPEA
ncbi:class I SAM-dependent methyltransferase [Streptomyces sp. P9(2023)]|uniref:class I SAM-dependent methyltransferase n=1 Tax=Streptomyces sp. P9(2023) TaxID=3064394 RepID=UPI0028F45CEE|nr:class I SAM-dependent methyltransferase [Streptomyces sp. P9(2023)]MDT9687311.1 class I SAM-dependent methyltransferase [Streptomyces sp. P9(2023)]